MQEGKAKRLQKEELFAKATPPPQTCASLPQQAEDSAVSGEGGAGAGPRSSELMRQADVRGL